MSFQIGEFVMYHSVMNWHIFRLNNGMRTSAKYVAVFPLSEKREMFDLGIPNQIFTDSEDTVIEVANYPSLHPYFASSLVAYLPLMHLPKVSGGREILNSKIFFYLYSLFKLEMNGLIPEYFTLDSVSLTDAYNGNWYWIDNRLKSSNSFGVSDKTYLFELKKLFDSLDNSKLLEHLRRVPITDDESKTVTRQYLDACIDFAVGEVTLDGWIDVRDDTGSISLNLSGKIIETAFNEVLQETMELIGIGDVLLPPQIQLTIENWKTLGIDLTQYLLNAEDYYVLQQVFDILPSSLYNENLYTILSKYRNNVPNKYPLEYIRSWKVAYLYFRG